MLLLTTSQIHFLGKLLATLDDEAHGFNDHESDVADLLFETLDAYLEIRLGPDWEAAETL